MIWIWSVTLLIATASVVVSWRKRAEMPTTATAGAIMSGAATVIVVVAGVVMAS